MSSLSREEEQADAQKDESVIDGEASSRPEQTNDAVVESQNAAVTAGSDLAVPATAEDGLTVHSPSEEPTATKTQEQASELAGDNASSQHEVQRQASEHLAHRAAEMTIQPSEPSLVDYNVQGASENAPSLVPEKAPGQPEKDGERPATAPEVEYDEKHLPQNDDSAAEVPETQDGSTDTTGAEIQSIMDQFEAGMGGLGEQEIMSPRIERQQPILVLPARSSSLENRENATLSPQITGASIKSQSSLERANGPPPFQHTADDNESVRSAKAGSIFQPPPPSPEPEASLPFDFHRFLEQLRHRTADPVARFLRSFLGEFAKKQWAVHEQVKIISDFLEFISKKMAQCEVWRTVSDAEFDNAREGMEKLVMNRLYSQTFSPAIPPVSGSPRKSGRRGRSQADAANPHGPGRRGQHQEDVERDDVIAQKIRIYGWIGEEHLDMKPLGDKGRKFMGLAQQELLKINSYRAPRDKVICVLNCCKVIFGYLKSAKADQSADAFVPLLIYTVLRARPEHLVSNVQYIWRFRNQDKLGGEAGYYMSSLMGVVTFIENLDRTNLTITDEEFERHVEQAVSAIAEENKVKEYKSKAHPPTAAKSIGPLSEKSALSRPEVTPRNSMDAEQSSLKRSVSQRLTEKNQQSTGTDDDDSDAVAGLLRTIQKPLNSIGRIFSDEGNNQSGGVKPANTPQPGSTPRGLSPSPGVSRQPSSADRSPQRRQGEKQRSRQRDDEAAAAAARQASAEAVEAQRVRAREHRVVVE